MPKKCWLIRENEVFWRQFSTQEWDVEGVSRNLCVPRGGGLWFTWGFQKCDSTWCACCQFFSPAAQFDQHSLKNETTGSPSRKKHVTATWETLQAIISWLTARISCFSLVDASAQSFWIFWGLLIQRGSGQRSSWSRRSWGDGSSHQNYFTTYILCWCPQFFCSLGYLINNLIFAAASQTLDSIDFASVICQKTKIFFFRFRFRGEVQLWTSRTS